MTSPAEALRAKHRLNELPDSFEPTDEERGLLAAYAAIRTYEREAKKRTDREKMDKVTSKNAEFRAAQQLEQSASTSPKRRKEKRKRERREARAAASVGANDVSDVDDLESSDDDDDDAVMAEDAVGEADALNKLREEILIKIEEMGLLDDLGARDAFVERLDLKHESLSNLADEAGRKPDGASAWSYIKTKVADAAKRDAKCSWFVQRLEEVLIAYVWPRIDFNVTKAVNHLIKSPLVAHPKTGRIAVPIQRGDILTFDPSRVPKLGDPNLAAALLSPACNLMNSISHEPLLRTRELQSRRRARAKRLREHKREHDALEDVEDLASVFSMDEELPAPPRPREVDRVRRPLAPSDLRKRAFVAHRPSPLAESRGTH